MNRIFTVLTIFLLLPIFVFGQTGQLSGKVTDLTTGEPLIGANIIIVGTSAGAATDIRGQYTIQNVGVGAYEVRASYIGYQSIIQTNVRVISGLTTELDFQLPGEGIEVDEVVVVSERPLIQRDNTNKIRTTTSDDIELLPVRGVDNIVTCHRPLDEVVTITGM